MHHKYANWEMPWISRPYVGREGKTLEDQVLVDLASTDNEWKKLEILDSYAAYYQRCYRAEMCRAFSEKVSSVLNTILKPYFESALPQVYVARRAAMGKAEEPFKVSGEINLGEINLDEARAEVERELERLRHEQDEQA